MNNFKKPYGGRPSNGRPGAHSAFGNRGKRSGGGAGRFGAGSRTPSRGGSFRTGDTPRLFDAVCSNCGDKCQVPFRPDGKKPVYCNKCFGVPRNAPSALKQSPSTHPTGEKSIADLTRQIAAMNAKIDTMLEILEGGAEE